MSYLMFQNMLRQQKKEAKTFTHAFNTKQRNTPIIGRLFIDNKIVPIIDIKYEKINKKIDKNRGFYYVNDGYKVIINVSFPKNLASKYILNYIVIKLKDDNELNNFKLRIKNNEIINFTDYEDYKRNQDG